MSASALLRLFYPERCPACDTLRPGGPGLCALCAESLYPLEAACLLCAAPQDGPRKGSLVCWRCREVRPPFRRVVAPYIYGGELAVALRRFKYGGRRGAGRPELARPLGALLAPALAEAARGLDLVVPVPVSGRRLRERGFSQAHRLLSWARQFARPPVPPVATAALRRVRHTVEQAGLPRAGRLQNVRGAFGVARRHRQRLSGRTVLLVDDVVTTGATAAACARALRAAGASFVDVLALCRAEA